MPVKEPELAWYHKAAELMVRNNMSLRQAVMELELALTGVDCDKIAKRRGFQDALRVEQHKFNIEIASDPLRTKDSLVGLAMFLVQKLINDAEYDKAVEALLKVARIQGWDKGDSINIFANLTSEQINAERKKLEAQLNTPAIVVPVN